MTEKFELAVVFDDQSPSFVHGYEAGQISQLLRGPQVSMSTTVHVANKEVLAKIADMRGFTVTYEDTVYSEWVHAAFEIKVAKPKLTVVTND